MTNLSKTEILSLDYGGKVLMLDKIGQEMLDKQIEFASVAGRYAELKAEMEVLKQVKSVLQSSIKAEAPEGGTVGQRIIKHPTYQKDDS